MSELPHTGGITLRAKRRSKRRLELRHLGGILRSLKRRLELLAGGTVRTSRTGILLFTTETRVIAESRFLYLRVTPSPALTRMKTEMSTALSRVRGQSRTDAALMKMAADMTMTLTTGDLIETQYYCQ